MGMIYNDEDLSQLVTNAGKARKRRKHSHLNLAQESSSSSAKPLETEPIAASTSLPDSQTVTVPIFYANCGRFYWTKSKSRQSRCCFKELT